MPWNKLREKIPSGPQALSLDVTYPSSKVDLYGIPERINTFQLKDTVKGEPYRLYNTDHFDDAYNFHTLYGTIPVVHSRAAGQSVTTGFLWANSSDSFVDIYSTESARVVHWFSESGALEFFVYPSGTPQVHAFKQKVLMGQMPMPNMFALGYH